MKWAIWFVTYGTYAEPDVPQRLVSRGLRFDEAQRAVARGGFGFCMKPDEAPE